MSVRVGVLLSGTGRTLENLLAEIATGRLDASVEMVISSRPGARGITVAEAAGIPALVIPRRKYASLESFGDAVYAQLDPRRLDLILMAGFLSRLDVRAGYEGRIMNIHPSLLPLFGGQGFYGERVHTAVLASGMKVSGCTVHLVDNDYDAGPIVLQRCVPVLDDDTPGTLGARVFAEECRLYPEAIRLFAAGRLTVSGYRVRILS